MVIPEILKKVVHFFNLEPELEHQDSVYEEIKKGIVFKGTNLWILMFAIVIASVGLNMNSTAVIIGAMLISPLMGPINGMGYSIATYDFVLFKKSIKNFTFAISASLLASTLYFAISPISTAHSELLARTSPTIYDVIIALFGGLAGIVAISSKQKGNVIPGVAIATALMPPLCTAGYGLATFQFNFFAGALYLFTINTMFIAIASVWISQLLKFPIRTNIEPSRKRRINSITNTLIVIVLIPSIYLGYKLVQHEEFEQKAKQYAATVSNSDGNYLLKYDIDAKKRHILLVYGGTQLSETQKNAIIDKSAQFNLSDAHIAIEQGLSFVGFEDKNLEVNSLKEQIASLNRILVKNNTTFDSINTQQQTGKILLNELKILYPQINGCGYSESLLYYDTISEPLKTAVIMILVNDNIRGHDKTKIKQWLEQRLKTDKVNVFYQNHISEK